MTELAREIIIQKINSLEENLTIRAIEVAAPKDLLSNIEEPTGKVASVKTKVKAGKKSSSGAMTDYKVDAFKNAKTVAKYMRDNPRITKADAIKELIIRGELRTRPTWTDARVNIMTQISPSVIGREEHDRLFAITRNKNGLKKIKF